MSTTQRRVRAPGCITATAADAVCPAWAVHAGAPVPRVLGFKPASRVIRSKSRCSERLHRRLAAGRKRRLRRLRSVDSIRPHCGSTRSDRRSASVQERYPTFADYDTKIQTAMSKMIQDRLLLCEDSVAELLRVRNLGVARGVPNPPATFPPYSFALANSSIGAAPAALWPPNGKMVPVSLGVIAPDTCNVSCNIAQITGTDGAAAKDWEITGPMTANLRSDRSGKDKNGRVCTMQLQCTDPATNLTSAESVQVNVPHDQRKN